MGDLPEQFPRPLTDREAETLRLLLSIDAPGIEELREQATIAIVDGKCPCGCATISLSVDAAAAPRSPLTRSPIIETHTVSKGDELPVGLLLFINDGWLSSIEIYSYDGAIPREFPAPEQVEPPRIRSGA